MNREADDCFVQVEVKKAEPRDVKLVADCHFDSSSLIIETTDRSAAGAADSSDDGALVSTPFTYGTVSQSCCHGEDSQRKGNHAQAWLEVRWYAPVWYTGTFFGWLEIIPPRLFSRLPYRYTIGSSTAAKF